MVGVLTLASIYVLGGLTFLPLCVAAFIAFLFYTSPVVTLPLKTGVTAATVPQEDDDAEPVTLYRAGWLVARRTYEPSKDNGDGTYVGMLTSSYKSFMDNRSKDPRRARPKDRFYAVLKHKTLYLYEGEDQSECWAAIEVPTHDVLITPEGYLDGELFAKRTAIELRPKAESVVDSLLEPTTASADREQQEQQQPSWFIFARVNSDKEDWYHSLVLASRLGSPTGTADVARDRSLFDAEDMARLVEVIDQQPDSIPMRWFNALLGRVFLAVYFSAASSSPCTARNPSKIQVGASVPLFSKPMLKDLNAEGDASMEAHVAYVGNARVTIETVATISLGSRFKPYTVRLVLAIVLKELEGTMLFKIKKPPSNRIWFGFTQMPKMVLSVEPVVSTRQIKWSLVTGPIESRIRELMMEALVLPHMDDISFFNTSSAPFSRGGIYGDFLRDPEPTPEEELNGPKREDREATHDDLGEEELVGEHGEGVSSSVGTSTATSKDGSSAAGLRPTAAFRRRRSSEGDHPQSIAAKSSETTTRSTKKTASSSTSVSSLAGLGASFAHWREQAKNGSSSSGAAGASTNTGSSRKDTANGPVRKSTWFGNNSKSASNLPNSNGPASASAPDLITRTPSVLSVASTDTTTSTTLPSASGNEDRGREEISAAKLRDILSKRAESRERERERERELERARELEADAAVARAGRVDVPLPTVAPQTEDSPTIDLSIADSQGGSSAATPALATDSGLTDSPELAFAELQRAESVPSHREEVSLVAGRSESASLLSRAESSRLTASSAQATSEDDGARTPPSLPTRPSWIKSSPIPDTASVMSSVAPSSDIASLPAPPPTHPRHVGSASVDSGGATLSTSASTLLSSWRTRAADKEALAAGVASAKESMRRWGANWAAKRATAKDQRGEDFDKVVGESPDKQRDGSADRYREHRRERESRDLGNAATAAGPAGGYFGGLDAEMIKPLPLAPKTPPRGRAGSSSAIATTVDATGASSTPPSTSRLIPSASTPSLALSPSNATAQGSPSTSPAKSSTLMQQQHSSSSSAAPSMSHAGGYGSSAATVGAGGMSAYGRRTMAVPGIRGEDRKKKVAEDHLGSTTTTTSGRGNSTTVDAPPLERPRSVEATNGSQAPTEEANSAATDGGNPAASGTSQLSTPSASRPAPPPLPTRKTSDQLTGPEPISETTVERAQPPPPPPLPVRAEQADGVHSGSTPSPPVAPARPALPARPSQSRVARIVGNEEEETAPPEATAREAEPASGNSTSESVA
ncbi:hypothetical protein JCM10908_003711 [Rhodotorula pacifica]|uniref:Nvj2p n=1 Tax=Rhodotorula pacifica TaxID=1495444 RepID=UPI003172B914